LSNCQVLFRVVADQLKLRGGLVRCGSCRHVFDAIGSLAYVDDASDAAALAVECGSETALRPRSRCVSRPVRRRCACPDARVRSPAPAGADARGDVRTGTRMDANRSHAATRTEKVSRRRRSAALMKQPRQTRAPARRARADHLDHSHSGERLVRSQPSRTQLERGERGRRADLDGRRAVDRQHNTDTG